MRRLLTPTALACLAAVALAGCSSSSGSESATTTISPPVSTLEASGCVGFNDVLPEGAPPVDVPVGPAPSTLQVTDLKTGTGPAVTAADTVTVNYIGVSCSTGKIFDSSWGRGQTATFGLNQVIPGWTEGLTGMQPGGERLLVIPPDLGYGPRGQGPIAPNETLVFVVDLVSAVPATPPAG
jgi:peptidylprolyl isomerase